MGRDNPVAFGDIPQPHGPVADQGNSSARLGTTEPTLCDASYSTFLIEVLRHFAPAEDDKFPEIYEQPLT